MPQHMGSHQNRGVWRGIFVIVQDGMSYRGQAVSMLTHAHDLGHAPWAYLATIDPTESSGHGAT